MNKTQLTSAIEKLQEIASRNQYKVVGKPETYNSYNEGWQDCADIMEQALIELLPKEREDMENTHAEGFADGLEQGINNTASPQSYDHNYFDTNFTQYKTNSNG